MGRTRVRLTVGKVIISIKACFLSIGPVSLEPSSKGATALLTTDTEVSIAPKPHQRSKSKVAPRDITSQEDPSKSPKLPEIGLRVLPTRLLEDVAPPSSAYTGPGTLAYVHSHTFSVLTETEFPTDEFIKVSYRHLPPPSDPLQASRNEADVEPPTSSTQRDADDLELGNQIPVEFSADNVLFVGSCDKVMESHVFLPNGIEGIGDWHWIQWVIVGMCNEDS